METWLILVGVLLPLAPTLQFVERRLSDPDPRRARVPDEPGTPVS
jgi:hypothetical protein